MKNLKQTSMHMPTKNHTSENNFSDSLSIIIENLDVFASLAEAADWLRYHTSDMNMPTPLDIYVKDDFSNIIFMKLKSVSERDEVLALLRSLALKRYEKLVWSKIDMPLPIRLQLSFLWGLRKFLVSWGFDKSLIEVCADTQEIKIEDCSSVKTKVEAKNIEYEWYPAWKSWVEFQSSSELRKSMIDAKENVGKIPIPSKGRDKTNK